MCPRGLECLNEFKSLEFREEEVVFSYFLTKTRISYDDIISLRKTNYFDVMLRSIAPFKPPLLSLPLGISWQCLNIGSLSMNGAELKRRSHLENQEVLRITKHFPLPNSKTRLRSAHRPLEIEGEALRLDLVGFGGVGAATGGAEAAVGGVD